MSREDLRDLLPLSADAAADPIMRVPPPGRGFGDPRRRQGQQQQQVLQLYQQQQADGDCRRTAADRAQARLRDAFDARHNDDATSPGSPSEVGAAAGAGMKLA